MLSSKRVSICIKSLVVLGFIYLVSISAGSPVSAGSDLDCARFGGTGSTSDIDNDDFGDYRECRTYDVSAVEPTSTGCNTPQRRCGGKQDYCVVYQGTPYASWPSEAVLIQAWPDIADQASGGGTGTDFNNLYTTISMSYCTGSSGGGGGPAPAPSATTLTCSPSSAQSPATFSYSYTNAPVNSRLSWVLGSATVSGSGNGQTGPITVINNAVITFTLNGVTAVCNVTLTPTPPAGTTLNYCRADRSIGTVTEYIYNLYGGASTYPPPPCDTPPVQYSTNSLWIRAQCYSDAIAAEPGRFGDTATLLAQHGDKVLIEYDKASGGFGEYYYVEHLVNNTWVTLIPLQGPDNSGSGYSIRLSRQAPGEPFYYYPGMIYRASVGTSPNPAEHIFQTAPQTFQNSWCGTPPPLNQS